VLIVEPTDEHSWVLSEEAGGFTDYTAKANSAVTPADDWQPWASPAPKDCIYWGHKNVMWDNLGVTLTTPAAGITGVWEFYDGDWRKAAPSSVTDLGGTLRFDLTSLLGAVNRQGTIIRVQLNETAAYEDVEVVWTGTTNIVDTGLLGQSTPSTDKDDYSVGSEWVILDDATDGTADLTQAGNVVYPIPQTATRNWKATTINDKEAFWLRYRIIVVVAPTTPVFQQTRIDEGKQYVIRLATQGRTFEEDPLGSSNGQAGQRFQTSKNYFIWDSEELIVEGDTWVRVNDFLNSKSTDKHYRIELGANDRATVVFGGPTAGKIPPVGAGNISITYRYGADKNGNVGADTVNIDKTGLTYINRIWNPRQATGWTEAQGASTESLERAKIEGPASIRIKDTALGPDDVVELTKAFTDEDGASPFSRARAIEEGFGPKTMELVVVASGGGLASGTQLDALDEYFNGNRFAHPPKRKHLVANQEVTSTNYSQRVIDITATVYGDVTQAAVENQLTRVIQPEALRPDGVTYEWEFGESIPTSRIIHEIFNIDDSIVDVDLTAPASDVNLLSRELPIVGVLNINVVEP